jgi:hypothetical protein
MKTTNFSIMDIPESTIQVWLSNLERSYKEGVAFEQYVPSKFKVVNCYFVGATLCLDIQFKSDTRTDAPKEVITINHSEESFGLFSGGLRKLLSLKSLRRMERFAKELGVNIEPKYSNRKLEYLIPSTNSASYEVRA